MWFENHISISVVNYKKVDIIYQIYIYILFCVLFCIFFTKYICFLSGNFYVYQNTVLKLIK